MELVMWSDPKSVLDVGIGFGKYGVLCREYLDVWGAEKFGERRHRIDGIEAFRDYLTPLQASVYDEIFVGDALEIIPKLERKYDLLLLIDVLEHFEFQTGKKLLELCKIQAKNIVVSTPLDMGVQGAVFGNQFETHRAQWTRKDLKNLGDAVFVPNRYSLICFIGRDAQRIRQEYKSHNSRIRPFIKTHFPRAVRMYRHARGRR
jgi:hypothetical protein